MDERTGPIFFFADAHLTAMDDPREREREARLDGFLAHARDRAGSLYILGDLFDFWFEYRSAIPKGHLKLFRRLHEIREAGVPMIFLSGNHDYWCAPFLAREFDVETHDGPIDVEIQGRRIWMAHGDGLIHRDRAYRRLRWVLRNRVCIELYRWLHPDIGVPLAHRSSSGSRLYTEQRDLGIDQYLREVIRPRFAKGYDAVILGHVHKPIHEREERGEYLFLGDWIRSFTYATLENGTFAQHHWA